MLEHRELPSSTNVRHEGRLNGYRALVVLLFLGNARIGAVTSAKALAQGPGRPGLPAAPGRMPSSSSNGGRSPSNAQQNEAVMDTDYSDSSWLSEIGNGYLPYHTLTASDFQVSDTADSTDGVYTAGFLHYQYNYRVSGRGVYTATLTSMSVRSGLDKNTSFRRSSLTDPNVYLRHEQGHLDLNELYAKKLVETVNAQVNPGTGSTPQSAIAALGSNIRAIFVRVRDENLSEQRAYDQDSGSGYNAVGQHQWEAKIAARLKAAGIKATWTAS